ncbi:MAG: 30S ribosomal protein S8e [Thermoplasmata archaeon]|nr:30S ribosomal protein S8e [Thermoplasmata archaeon]
MSTWQGRSRRKKSGGRRLFARKKRKFELGSDTVNMTLGETRTKAIRGRGGSVRHRLLKGQLVNVSDPKDGTTRQVKMVTVLENPANPHYVRRNIITKGAIVETEAGKARITSRPGQDGIVNAVLLK